jgi:hypothetical protein
MTADLSIPMTVQRAALCLWVCSALCLAATLSQVTGLVETVGAGIGSTAVIGLITASFMAWIAVKISGGRNWARWLFAVVYVIGTVGSALIVLVARDIFFAAPAILQGNMVVQLVLQTAAIVLLFTTPSQQWFRYKHAESAA